MKQEIKPATGRLGVLVVGVGGAVATTMIVGTLASRKGLAKPIGSITQLATMRMENNEEKLIKDVVPLTNLEDIVSEDGIFPGQRIRSCYVRRGFEKKTT